MNVLSGILYFILCRFKKLDLDRSGTLSVGEFLSVPELKENPLVKRVVNVFDADHSGEVDFKEFVKGLAMFAVKTTEKEKKLRFMFNIYDMDEDGYISNGELFKVATSNVYFSTSHNQCCQQNKRTWVPKKRTKEGLHIWLNTD